MKSPITTHVLDIRLGKPAAGISVQLQRMDGDQYATIAQGQTNYDGRVTNLVDQEAVSAGCYRLIFTVADYFTQSGVTEYFYPVVIVEFLVHEQRTHYHVPLLLSPFGYSTYRGS